MSAQEVGTLVIEENGETKIDYDKAILAIEINKARFSNADKRIQTLRSFKAHNNPKVLSL
jgi:hypothetical protein